MNHLLQDLRYALRMLWKTPGQTGAAVIALGLGIGLTAAMFSIVYGIVLRGLPLPEAGRLVSLDTQDRSRGPESLGVGLLDFLDWRKQQTSFTGLAAFSRSTFSLSGDEVGDARPERLIGAFVTANLFDLIGAKPARGRLFLPGEDLPGDPRVAILSWQIWQGRYGGDPAILGRTVRVNAEPATVVGILPPRFEFPFNQKIWLPLAVDPAKATRGDEDTYQVVGRLKPGISLEAARAEIEGISERLAAQHPDTQAGVFGVVQPLRKAFLPERISNLLFLMLAGVFCVLLIACLNVANLMLARASVRTHELAIRSALGAGRRRVLIQVLAESSLISAFGAVLGFGLAVSCVAAFNRAIVPLEPPYWWNVELDRWAFLFTLGLSSLRLGWFSRTLVVAEIAFSCLLLVMAGLMVKSVVRVDGADRGFDGKKILTFRVALLDESYPTLADRIRACEQILGRLDGKPGTLAVAATSSLPYSGTETEGYAVEGRAYSETIGLPEAHVQTVSPGYFEVFDAPLLGGRDFSHFDREGTEPVAIVNASFAARAFPGEAALGARIRLGPAGEGTWRRIVAVVPDLGLNGFNDPDPAGIYLPLSQSLHAQRMSYVVRATGNPLALTEMARAEVAAVDADLPIYFAQTMEQAVARSGLMIRLFSTLFSIFGAAALLLASVGIYAVVSFSIGRRTEEIGVRLALGAAPSRVMRLLLGQGARQLLAGLAFGIPASLLVSGLLTDYLYEVRPNDPWVVGGVSFVLGVVTLLACLVPAQRALRGDSMMAFRKG